MNGKDYAISVALSAAAGLVLMFFIWLLSLISWALVWAVFAFAFVPLGMKVIQYLSKITIKDLELETSDFIYKGE